MKTFTVIKKNELISHWDLKLGNLEHLDLYKYSKDPGAPILDNAIDHFKNRFSDEYKEFLYRYAVKFNLPKKICVLNAHGGDLDGKWFFHDDELNKYFSVNSFLECYDGKYCLIVLCVCNELDLRPVLKKSCVIFGDGLVGNKNGIRVHDENFFRSIPNFEPVSPYTVEYDTKLLV